MKKYIIHIIAATALLFLLSGSIFSQTNVQGYVLEGAAGTPVAGLNLVVVGTSTGLMTDGSGRYVYTCAAGIPVTIRATIIGYSAIERTITPVTGANYLGFWFGRPVSPTVTISGTATVCKDAMSPPNIAFTVANGSSPYRITYKINGGANQTINSLTSLYTIAVPTDTPGTFTFSLVSLSDLYSDVSASGNATATINPLPATPTITAGGPTTFCSGGSVTLSSSAGSSYLWSTGATTASINVITSGSYTVRVTNAAGCQSAASVATVVAVNALPATPTITPGGPTTFCAGGSVTLTSSVGTSYLWSTGATTQSINVTTSGSYAVRITNASGCQSATSVVTVVTVNALPAIPTITAGGPTTFCVGGSVTLSSSAGSSYLWSNGATTASINVATSGSYTVRVTNASVCQSAASAATIVTVNPLPATPTITAGGPTTFCTGGSVTLTSSLGTSYLWSTGATTASLNVTISGSYTVRVLNAVGCQSASSAATIVTVNPLPTATAINNGPVCSGSQLSLAGGPNEMITYAWTGPNDFSSSLQSPTVSASATVAMAGAFTLTVTSSVGCQNTATTTVTVNPTPAAPTVGPITQPTCVLATGSVVLNGLPEGSWTINPGNIAGSAGSHIIVNLAEGTHNFTVTNEAGCISPASAAVVIAAQPATPTASSAVATEVASASATLRGTVNANNAIADITFEYGLTPGYGSSINAVPSPVTGTNPTSVSASITGLTANTTYYFRVKADGSGCIAYGNDLSFTTDKEYQLEYISGNNQTFPGGGMPFPMVFKIRNVTDNVYVTNLTGEGLSMFATAPSGHQDAAFNNLTDYCGEGINSSCFGGYYYVEPNHASPYVLSITVTLEKDDQPVSVFTITENISGTSSTIVSNVADSGPGSLRNAIAYANSTGGIKDTITFNIPGTGPFTIQPSTPFPEIADPVIIDGYSQPGSSPASETNPATFLIQIDGTNAGETASGLDFNADNCSIAGLSITNFRFGIYLNEHGNNFVRGNLISANRSCGIFVYSSDNEIGGITPASRNILSGNSVGIALVNEGVGGSPGWGRNKIMGNYIGVDPSGNEPSGNSTGIMINDSPYNIIGGTVKEARNVISSNGTGIQFSYFRVDPVGNKILGNYIGTNADGKQPLGNTSSGIWVEGQDNFVGDATTGSGNLISGNGTGIRLGKRAIGNMIKGNYIGTDYSGYKAIPNTLRGIEIRNGNNNQIGGLLPGEGNLISGNSNEGILIFGEFDMGPNPADGNIVKGNYVGTDRSGLKPLGNGTGIRIGEDANTNVIGGMESGAGNIIAFNNNCGIVIADPDDPGTGNKILSNSIHSNGGPGIDLGDDGVTENDDGDTDTGANGLQNYPVIDSVNFTSNSVFVSGHLNSLAYKEYTLEFFASKVADNTGFGEGRTYLGSETVATTNSSTVSFSKTFSRSSGWGDVITATATDANGNTSEFSMAVGGLQDQIIGTASWPFRFLVNEEGIPRITNGTDITAVRESFNTWENISTADIDFVDGGTTAIRNVSATDGMNLVSFTDEKFPFPKGVLAMAAKTLRVNPDDDVAYIIDADIVVNPKFVLNDVGVGYGGINEGYYDAQSIITHEIGHVLGLIHTGVVDATMFFMLDKGTNIRSLEQDDRSWASYKYPDESYNSTFGSISGRITYGEDPSRPPVAGALIIATNVAEGFSVHAYSDADGNYTVPGLPAGNYNIYIQPLDGDVYGWPLKPGNISTYIYCNTIYTDYPAEYLSAGDSEEETEIETPLVISVSAGNLPTSVIDIVTNKDLTPPEFVSVRPTNVLDDKVRVMSDFLIRFSEPVDMATFTEQTCYLDLNGTKLGGSYTPLADSLYIILFNPGSELEFDSQYTLNLTNGIMDLKGNQLHLTSAPAPITYTFSTVGKDGTPPKITSTSPVNEADSVFVTAKIKVLFSESMNTESVNGNFALSWEEGDPAVKQTVEGAISWDNEKRNLTFTPYASLREDEEYTILISAEVTDLSGNQMGTNSLSVFETVEDAAPIIIYLGPTGNQSNVTIETPIVADFSEPIDPSTVNTSTFSLKVTGSETAVPGTFDFLNSNSRVVFRPETNLAPGTGYSVLLTAGISDVSDPVRFLEAEASSFTTAAEPVSPHITYLEPANGKAGNVITIAGAGFDPEIDKNTILFNGIIAYAKTASLNTLTTEVPMATLSGPVTVTVNNRVSNQMQFTIISDYENDPTDYVVTNKSLGSGSSGGSDIGGEGEAVFAMVTNPDGNLVTRIGLGAAAGGIETITVGLYPLKVDIDPQGNRAYVTNYGSHDVSVIDLSSNSVVKTIPVGENPYGVVVTPDGKRVYVSNTGSGDLSLIDADPSSGGFDHVVANVPIGSNSGGVDVTGDAGVANVRTGSNSGDITVTGDAGMVLVTGDFGLWIVDSDQESDDYNSVIANVSSGTKTNDVTVTADAGFAIVSTVDGSLLIINLHPEYDDYSGAVIANVPTGTKVSDVKASADAVYIYATDTENDQILVYKFSLGGSGSSGGSSASGVTLIPLDQINVDDAPYGLSISPAGDKIYTITGSADRSVTTITITGGILSPASSIAGLIVTVQTMINEGQIPKVRGNALIVILNAALRNVYNDRPKLAIVDLKLFIATVKTYIKNKQINSTQGNALIISATAIINQLSGAKSGEEEFYYSDIEMETDQDIVSETRLGIIYPNPTKDGITIDYEIAEDMKAGKVSIKVYDVTGRVIGNLVNETMEPGRYSTTWNGRHENGTPVSRGIYYIRFSAGKASEVKRIMLVR